MKKKKQPSNSYTASGSRTDTAALRLVVEAARVVAVADGRARRKAFAAAWKPPMKAPPRKHNKLTAAERLFRKCERRQEAADLEAEMELARMRTAASRRQRSQDQASRQLEREATKARCTIGVRRRFIEAGSPRFRRHKHVPDVCANSGRLPAVDDDGFANLTLKIWGPSRDSGNVVGIDKFAEKCLYITDPAALCGSPAEAIMTNMVRPDRDGQIHAPGSNEFNDEIVAMCRALSELERDIERKTKDGQHAQPFVHLMLALPAGLTADQRRKIVAEIVQRFEDAGLPYVAALHSPSGKGDDRNFHVHIVLSKRPFVHAGSRAWKFAATKDQQILDKVGVRILRADAVHAYNRALQQAGIAVQFTALTREERGLTKRGKRVGYQPGEAEMYQAKADAYRENIAKLDALETDRSRLIKTTNILVDAAARLQAAKARATARQTEVRVAAVRQFNEAAARLAQLDELSRRAADATTSMRDHAMVALRARWRQTLKAQFGLLHMDSPRAVLRSHVVALQRGLMSVAAKRQRFDKIPKLQDLAEEHMRAVALRQQALDALSARMERAQKAQLAGRQQDRAAHLPEASPIAAVIAPPVTVVAEPTAPAPPAPPRTALEVALFTAREPQFAELKMTSSEFARALDGGKIRFEQAAEGVLGLSVSDIETGRALWRITESAIGYDYLQRVMREAPAADAAHNRRGFHVVVEKGRTTFPDPHRNALLPVLYKDWRELEPGLRYHAMVIIDAAAGYPYKAALGTNRDEFFVRAPAGSAPLESALAMRRSVAGRRLLYALAQVSPGLEVGLTRGWREVEYPRPDRQPMAPVLEQAPVRTAQPATVSLSPEQERIAKTYVASVQDWGAEACYRVVTALVLDQLTLSIDPNGRTIRGWARDASLLADLTALAAIPARRAQLLKLAGHEAASIPHAAHGWHRWQSDRVGHVGTAEHPVEFPPPRGPHRDLGR